MFPSTQLQQLLSLKPSHTVPPLAAAAAQGHHHDGEPEAIEAQLQYIYGSLLSGINQQLQILDLHYDRWNKQRSDHYKKIFRLLWVQIIFLLVLSLINNILCSAFTSTAVFLVLLLTIFQYNWVKSLRFANNQLSENKTRKARLQQIWHHLRLQGLIDPILDHWFLFDPLSLPDYTMIALFTTYCSLLLWALNLVLTCWASTKH